MALQNTIITFITRPSVASLDFLSCVESFMTDCIFMQSMHSLKFTDVLTHDEHFSQEGFQVLFGKALTNITMPK